jgi:inhibitor of cysteine peptidase
MDGAGATLANDHFDVRQNSSEQLLDVLGNDVFDQNYAGERKITSVSFGTEGGRVEITADGKSIRYAPPADFGRSESFVYYVDNEFSATVNVAVRTPLDADTYTLTPDRSQYRLQVMANDLFWDGYTGARRITSVSTSQHDGVVRIADDGVSIEYTLPADGPVESDKFIYIVDDRYPAEVTIRIENPLQRDEFEIIQNSVDQPLIVLANDSFWDGYTGARRITVVSPSAHEAEITIADQGRSLLYTPAKDFSGFDTFHYIVDGRYEASVMVLVHRPVQDDSVVVDVNSSDFLFDLLSNDYYHDRAYRRQDVVDRITSVTASAKGGVVEVTEDGMNVRYSPPAGYEGNDSFEYMADGKYPAKVSVAVTRPVRDDQVQVYEDSRNNRLDVRANDFIGNGYEGPRRITSVGESPAGGTVVISDDGLYLLYTPKEGYTGQDTFHYTIDDSELEAIVSVWVSPLTNSDYFAFCPSPGATHRLPVLENDHFRESYSGPGIITSVEVLSGNGHVTIAENDRSLIFDPEGGGSVRFRYTVDGKYHGEGNAHILSNVVGDQFTVNQNSLPTQLDVLTNDYQSYYGYQCNEYTGPKKVTSAGPSKSGGTVQVSDDGRTILYSPPVDFFGTDTFTYVVDGIMQGDVRVNVIRRVRDDQFHVDPGTTNNVLPVLINDLFGDYRGPRNITSVTSTAAGGSAAISADQKSIIYTPAASFTGVDSFTYKVDGALLATVQVHVNASLADQFPRFASQEAFQQLLMDDALTAYEGLFGREAYPHYWGGLAYELASADMQVANRLFSDTNVQVAGVDEADLIENDGEYLYSIVDRRLAISRAWPADQLTIMSETLLEGQPIGMYLLGNRLTVVARESSIPTWDVQLSQTAIWRPERYSTKTIVTTYDVSDRAAPHLIQKTRFDGSYFESRRIGNYVYVVTNQNYVSLPTPKITCEDEPTEDQFIFIVGRNCHYETKDEYFNRVNESIGELINNVLPHYESFDANGQLVRSGLLNAPEDIFAPIWERDRTLMSVVSIDMTNDEPGFAATAGAFTSPGAVVYGSLDSLYVANSRHDQEEVKTDLIQFDWDSETGGIELAASGSVSGRLLDQFSLDEFDGQLRIATTVINYSESHATSRNENLLFIVADDGGVLELVGGLQNMGLDETIRSVRFMGRRAFVTTFRERDPLFAVDLSDATQPRWVGHLTMPGFSSYMQFIDENHILGVGRNTTGFSGPTQVALFDVTDLQRPVLIDQHTFAQFSTSEAEEDHHAFGWFSAHDILAMPMSRAFWQRTDEDGDGYRETRTQIQQYELVVFRIDVTPTSRSDQGIQQIGTVAHEKPVRRSAFIDNVLYSVANDSIKAVEIQNPTNVYGVATFSPEVADSTNPNVDAMGMYGPIAKARQDLASRLGVHPGELLALSADRASDETPVKIVFRSGPKQYLYAAHGESVELIGDDFHFQQIVHTHRHNAVRPKDTNNDGQVAPIDALIVINHLAASEQRSGVRSVVRQIDAVTEDGQSLQVYADVDNDGTLAPIDVLIVINHLNAAKGALAEGEGMAAWVCLVMNDDSSAPLSSAQAHALVDESTREDASFQASGKWTQTADSQSHSDSEFLSPDLYATNVDWLLGEDDLLAS